MVGALCVVACGSQNPPSNAPFDSTGYFSGGDVLSGADVADSSCIGGTGESCNSDADCDDGLACTADSCDPCNQKCHAEVSADNCLVAGKCWAADDGPLPCIRCKPETSNTGLTPTPNAPCDDGDACTSETVCNDSGTCQGKAIEGCCEVAKDCDDDDACTADACDDKTKTCSHEAVADCCSTGACCGPATGKVLPAGTKCAEEVLTIQYQCDGPTVQRRIAHPGCDGKGADGCSKEAAHAVWGQWQDVETCTGAKKCLMISSDIQPTCSTTSGGGSCKAHADCEDYLPCTLSFCDAGKCGNFAKEAGTKCGQTAIATEYGCDGFGDGSDIQVRQGFAACDGVSGACDANSGVYAWGPWKPHELCASGTSCSVPDSSQPGTCVKGPPPTKCKPGSKCCTADGQYAPKATKCGTSKMKTEYFCNGGGNGSDVMKKYAYSGCSGYSTSCSSSSSNLNWVTETYKKCSSSYKCQVKYKSSPGTCIKGDKCKPGTTCCPDGQYAAKGTKCGSSYYKKQYTCSGSGKGNTIMVQEVWRGCSGYSTSCSSSSSNLYYGPSKKYKKCSSSTSCSVNSSGSYGSCKS